MMLPWLLFAASCTQHKCMHGEFVRLLRSISPETKRRAPRSVPVARSARAPIRIVIDRAFIETPDSYTCSWEGELIDWGMGPTICTQADVPTPEKQQVILETLANVKSFYDRILTVSPCQTPFPLVAEPGFPTSRTESDGQTDMYFTVYMRPFGEGSSTLAAAAALKRSSDDGRPIQGVVFVNIAQVPRESQSYDTKGNRAFFEVLVHELMHAFAVSHTLWDDWIDSRTGLPYKSGELLYSKTVPAYPGKTFTIIRTPKIHEVIARRWGAEYFFDDPNCSAGVEIEDGGGQGTGGAHWEIRTHLTEIMTGATIGNQRISELTLAAAEDSGWYGVNYSVAEPVLWGDWRSIVGAKFKDFKTFGYGPPVTSFPMHYVLQPEKAGRQSVCTFDHQGLGELPADVRDCGGRTDRECAYPQFYDPNNTGWYGHELPDYALIALSADHLWCKVPGNAMEELFYGGAHGPGAMCAMTGMTAIEPRDDHPTPYCFNMSCPSDAQLLIHVGNETQGCSEAGTKVSFKGYYGNITCPDPAIVCGVLRYPVNVGGESKDDKLSTGAIIAIVVVVVVVVAAVVVVIMILKAKRAKDAADNFREVTL